jgi:hypothetical protein
MIINTIRVDYDTLPLDKTALQTLMLPQDRYIADHNWHAVATYFEHGKVVDKIDVMTPHDRYTFSTNDLLNVRNLGGKELTQVRINRIRMMETSQFSETDYIALGFVDEANYADSWGAVISGRVWIFDITLVGSKRDTFTEKREQACQRTTQS